MSNPSTLSLQLAASVANGIALAQQPLAAGALTLNGSLVVSGVGTLDVARRILIASTGNDASVVFTITGTGRPSGTTAIGTGPAQIETITGLNANSAFTNMDFATVSSVTSSAATVGNITVGTNGVGSSPWVADDFLARFWALAGGITGPVGTTYTLESTWDDPNDTGQSATIAPYQFSMNPASFVPPKAWAHPTVQNLSGDNTFDYANRPIMAHRLTITAGTGLVTMQSMQACVGSGF